MAVITITDTVICETTRIETEVSWRNIVPPGKIQPWQRARLAIWQTYGSGLDWLNKLVEADRCIDLGGNGYPRRYTATAVYIVPKILGGSARSATRLDRT